MFSDNRSCCYDAALYQQLFEVGQIGIWEIWFPSGRCLFRGESNLKLLTGKDVPFIETTFDSFLQRHCHPEDHAYVLEQITRICSGELVRWVEYRVRDAEGGGWQWIYTFGAIAPDSTPEETHLVGGVQNLHNSSAFRQALEQIQLEAARSTEAKDRFLANMSHEIRTPMNAVLGMLHLMNGTRLDKRQQHYLDNALLASKSLLRLLGDVLDHAKIEAGKLELEQTAFSLQTVLQELLGTVLDAALQKGLRLTCSIAPDVPPTLVGDPLRLRQVLLNLVDNAIKFTGEGGVGVEVSLVRQSETAAVVGFRVQDTGPGIDPRQAEALFAPFTQADSSTTRRHGGTGLGLSIAGDLVKLMGGQIRCEALDDGTAFAFTTQFALPDPQPDDAPEPPPAQPETPESWPALQGARILLAEDNEINRILVLELLQMEGCLVDTAETGTQVLEQLQTAAYDYDCILMDVQMPEMDGLSATRVIRGDPRWQNLPILALTAHAMAGHREASLAAGMNGHITKPIEPASLYRTLQWWLENPSAGRPRERSDP